MQRFLPCLLLALLWAAPASAAGLLIPSDPGAAPLEMLDHKVSVVIDEQVAVTRVEQTFHNPSDRQLEATYVFPVPRGASVSKFAMWVGGKEVKGEMVEADKARSIYTDVVRRMQDPGLLEYMGNNLLKLRVFPVPAKGDQKVAVSFTSVNDRDSGMVEYTYPLRTDKKAARTLQKFRIDVALKSHDIIHNVYSPTHPVTVEHKDDHHTHAHFECKQGLLDRDFHLYYALGKKDIGLTALFHRTDRDKPGHFLLLVSPRADLSQAQALPRDMVFVLDTSGSMAGPKMQQARNAVKFCIDRLAPQDRFAVLNFATMVGQFSDGLSDVDSEHLAQAKKWIDGLEANGGTAIDAALKSALDLRPAYTNRTFTVVFFTDGEPTVGETSPDKIVKEVINRNSENTRIFTFGVDNDVNATLLDSLADSTRAVSTYVRPEEDIEAKVSSLHAKISHPVLTDLKLSASQGVKLSEVYPNNLPDLFHGGQLVVLGRYTGAGHQTITLHGKVGGQTREFVYEVNFPAHTGEDCCFVEGLWARRKVGYLLDEIRRNGENKELVDEVTKLARKHGITTPYTSYRVVSDNVPPRPQDRVNLNGSHAHQRGGFVTSNNSLPGFTAGQFVGGGVPALNVTQLTGQDVYPPDASATGGNRFRIATGGTAPSASSSASVESGAPTMIGDLLGSAAVSTRPENRTGLNVTEDKRPVAPPTHFNLMRGGATAGFCASDQQKLREALASNQAHSGKLGVDFAVQLNNLRNQKQLDGAHSRKVAGRTCRQIEEINGEFIGIGEGAATIRYFFVPQIGPDSIWVDDGFDGKQETVMIKTLSKAYFRMLEMHAEIKEVFQLGNGVVWVTPSGTALIITPNGGKEAMSDEEIEQLFVKK